MTVKSTVAHPARDMWVRCFGHVTQRFPQVSECLLAHSGAVRSPVSMTCVTLGRKSCELDAMTSGAAAD
ncbi:hypothetical protein [Nocardia cyriacigeorgica]|uniref:hypothetical protein n=2 Tax=Nocardia cyriacigeorgica TaxID=135487 RepID=UPI0024589D0E|nr:hypothetical protein [Nocardia cyriacigeorgica]